jgi:flagellin-like hook-associated protein FlgL
MTKTNTPQVKIVNVETGEEIIRDANAKELAQMQADKVIAQAAFQAKAKAEADKAALLARLGLTEDEAKLLLS